MKAGLKKIWEHWKAMRKTRSFRSVLRFLAFVPVAALFWFLMALNENVQSGLDLRVHIVNVPDSVTFINDPPQKIHITVRDKGMQLLRIALMHEKELDLDFKYYATDGVMRVAAADMYSSMRSIFGSSAQISSASIDSLHLEYTTNPGRRVPVKVVGDFTAAPGYVIAGLPRLSQRSVLLYSAKVDLDTVRYVSTSRLTMRNLSEDRSTQARLQPIKDVKMVPSSVRVTIPVETLVKKRTVAHVQVRGVPAGESLLIFPANAEVTCFVPMTKYNQASPEITVVADYADIDRYRGGRIPLRIESSAADCFNPTLVTDSVEYTIVR